MDPAIEVPAAREAAAHHLNCFTQFDPGRASAQAERTPTGPLTGMVCGVKDNIDVAGWATTAGTSGLREWRPQRTASVAQRLFDAGAVLIGKTNMHELALGVTSNNPVFGPVRNPADPGRIAGGSSGGSAAAVAAGILRFALGSDTAGSCRIPAALCGCVGWRPTIGRYPIDGVVPLSLSRDTVGVLARDLKDLRNIDSVCAGDPRAGEAEPGLTQLRLGIPEAYFYENVESGVASVMRKALARLEAAGFTLTPVALPDLPELTRAASFPIIAYEMPRDIAMYLASHRAPINLHTLIEAVVDPAVRGPLLQGISEPMMPASAYHAALAARAALRARYAKAFGEADVAALIIPVTPLTARPIGEEIVDLCGTPTPALLAYLRNTDPGSCAGLPGLCIPAGRTPEGLPVGLGLDGMEGGDRALLALGAVIERVLNA